MPSYMGLIQPTDATLRKYGLTPALWRKLVHAQLGRCGACGKRPKKGRLVIDHEHCKGWRKLPPEERRKYVRGLLDWTCNHYRLGKGATIDNLRGAAEYLIRYETRKADS